MGWDMDVVQYLEGNQWLLRKPHVYNQRTQPGQRASPTAHSVKLKERSDKIMERKISKGRRLVPKSSFHSNTKCKKNKE